MFYRMFSGRRLIFLPVDRILRKQVADRQAAEDLIREKSKQLALLRHDQEASAPPVNLDHKSPGMATTASTDVASTSGSHDSASLRSQSDTTVSRPPSMIRNSLGNWRRKFTGKDEHAPQMPGGLPAIHDEQQLDTKQPLPSGPSSRPRTPQAGVTPQSNIGKFLCVFCIGNLIRLPIQLQTSMWQSGHVERRRGKCCRIKKVCK